MAELQEGQIFRDNRRPGRWVKVLTTSPLHTTIETVRAADEAMSSRAVGLVTQVDTLSFGRHFTVVPLEEVDRELPHEGR